MPTRARTYIQLVSAVGIVVLGSAFWPPLWPHDPLRIATYFLLALLASALKLPLPGLTGTMSIGFVFVLLGTSELSLSETMLIACPGVVLQCYWRAAQRPRLVQVVFNVAAAAISVVLAYRCAHFAGSRTHGDSVTIPMAVATCVYFVASSLLVSGVLARLESTPLRKVWERCYLLSCPYYLFGGVVAGLVASSSRQAAWQPPLLIMPAMALAYLFYRIYLSPVASRLAAR